MNFWFKRKKIILDCFTMDPFAFNHAPISKAKDYLPEFWKKIDLQVEDGSTLTGTGPSIKYCRAFNVLYKDSFIVPLWGNITFSLEDVKTKTFQWFTSYTNHAPQAPNEITVHPKNQFEGFADDYQHAKIMSPWSFKTNRFVNFLISDPIWNRNSLSDYSVLPGIMDFKYQDSAHVNIMMEYRSQPRIFEIEATSPLIFMTPLTEESVDVRCHLVDYQEYIKHSFFKRISSKLDPHKKYQKNRDLVEKMEKRNKPQCPFGFKK